MTTWDCEYCDYHNNCIDHRTAEERLEILIEDDDQLKQSSYPVMYCTICDCDLDQPENFDNIPEKERQAYIKWCGEKNIKPEMLCCWCADDLEGTMGLRATTKLGQIINKPYVIYLLKKFGKFPLYLTGIPEHSTGALTIFANVENHVKDAWLSQLKYYEQPMDHVQCYY